MQIENKEKQLEALVIINILLLLAFLFFKDKAILIGSIVFSFTCLLSSPVLWVVYKIWNSFFFFLGEMNSRILLFIVFFFILVPIASVKKIFSRKQRPVLDNFKNRDHIFTAADLERMG